MTWRRGLEQAEQAVRAWALGQRSHHYPGQPRDEGGRPPLHGPEGQLALFTPQQRQDAEATVAGIAASLDDVGLNALWAHADNLAVMASQRREAAKLSGRPPA